MWSTISKPQDVIPSKFMQEPPDHETPDARLDQQVFKLDLLKFEQFLSLLDAPPKTNESLRCLLNHRAPWD